MIRFAVCLLAFVALSFAGLPAQGTGGPSAQAVYVGPVAPNRVVDVLRVARPQLEAVNCCSYSLGFLVSRYQQGQLEIGYLGAADGKEWYRVVYGGGALILNIENNL